jgi:hypothetical protein
MGTYCALHVKTKDKGALVSGLERYLAEIHRGRVIQTTVAETCGKLYGDEFLCSEKQPPTKFALISELPGWFTAHYNSFFRLRELAADISGTLNTVAIILTVQTCSSAYLLSISELGRHLRTLEFADGNWISQEGAPLPFESQPLGKNVAEEGEEPWYVFEDDSVREYCEHFGLKLWTDAWMEADHPEFTIIRALPARVAALEERD